MIKKNIKYTDYNGVERSEDFYFNLNKAELMEMEYSTEGGLGNIIKKVIKTEDSQTLIKIFKDLVLKAYGEKSEDGKRFIKIDKDGIPLSRKFSETEAYSVLFMELATNSEAASEFVNGITPSQLVANMPSPDKINDTIKAIQDN